MTAFIVGDPIWIENSARPVKRDYLKILDAVYDLRAADQEWLTGVLRATNAAIGRGCGAYAFYYDVAADFTRLYVQSPVFLDCPSGFLEACMSAAPEVGSELIRAAFLGAACRSFSDAKASLGLVEPSEAERIVQAASGLVDQFVVNAWETPGHGTAVLLLAEKRMPFPRRNAAIMTKVSRHIAAGRRLREFVQRGAGVVSVDADAVLTPEGKVLHAEPNSAGKLERSQLSEAVRVLAESRQSLAKSDPEAVVRLWTALVQGQWSLVSSVDTDGKRFMVARRNAPSFRDPAALTREERHLAVLFAAGHPGKLVAYELGLAPSTVSQRLKSVLRKLKLRSLAELVQILGP
ncbi:MAG: helix-turn-helix transcriptional regulator [Polyangiaceae bacterium]|nr:helix-turn-helix transcriptional regulator [Polyangiaceae bacterium]